MYQKPRNDNIGFIVLSNTLEKEHKYLFKKKDRTMYFETL